jgi:hypothetical protein
MRQQPRVQTLTQFQDEYPAAPDHFRMDTRTCDVIKCSARAGYVIHWDSSQWRSKWGGPVVALRCETHARRYATRKGVHMPDA